MLRFSSLIHSSGRELMLLAACFTFFFSFFFFFFLSVYPQEVNCRPVAVYWRLTHIITVYLRFKAFVLLLLVYGLTKKHNFLEKQKK